MATTLSNTTVNHWKLTCEQHDHGTRTYTVQADSHHLHVEVNVEPQGLTRHVVTMTPSSLILTTEHLSMFQAHVNQAAAAVRYFQQLIDAHHDADALRVAAWQQATN